MAVIPIHNFSTLLDSGGLDDDKSGTDVLVKILEKGINSICFEQRHLN